MLNNLTIKNIALIDNLEIPFGNKLNVLSGETGAGKSLILDSITLLLGEKPSDSIIRNGEETAEITGVFNLENKEILNEVLDLGIEIDDDNLLIIHRTLNRTGRNSCRINGKISTIGIVKALGALLVDIHGQHEHQLLLSKKTHIDFLDRFCHEDIDTLKNDLNNIFITYNKVNKDIEYLLMDDKEKENKLNLYNYQIEEISSANLKPDEEEQLQNTKNILQSMEKLMYNTNKSIELLYENTENDSSALDKITIVTELINEISKHDKEKIEISQRLNSVLSELDDIGFEIKEYFNNLSFNNKEIELVEKRLDIIYNLKRKYGNNINLILGYLDKITKEKELIDNNEIELIKLKEEREKIITKGNLVSEKISTIRKKEAFSLENQITIVLIDLGMKDVIFKINFVKKETFNKNGFDDVEFLISPNLGEDLKPLVEIASGGEMSRIMLAIKTIIAKYDNIETFIFDEIDTGVSGRTAQKVAEKLNIIGNKHQILCITHLPQIAAMANDHYLIEKEVANNKTYSNFYILNHEEKTREIARLIGGAIITDKTLRAASEMIEFANELK